MIKKYQTFNESSSVYPYNKVYFEINSMDDANRILSYLDNILGFEVNRFTCQILCFPNWMGIFTNIHYLRNNKITYFSDYNPTINEIEIFIRNNNYDPVILQMKDLPLLKSIIFNGNKKIISWTN